MAEAMGLVGLPVFFEIVECMADGVFNGNMVVGFLAVNISLAVENIEVGESVGVVVTGNLDLFAVVEDNQHDGEIHNPPGARGESDIDLEVFAPVHLKTFPSERGFSVPPLALLVVRHRGQDVTRSCGWERRSLGSRWAGRISDKCNPRDRGHPARFGDHAGWKPTVLSAEIRLALIGDAPRKRLRNSLARIGGTGDMRLAAVTPITSHQYTIREN